MGQLPYFPSHIVWPRGLEPRARIRDTADVVTDERIAAGAVALRAGRWEDARAAFEAALAGEETGAAHAGLGDALWWLGDVHGALSRREHAYAAFRRAGDTAGAVTAAIKLCIDYKSSLGNHPAAAGWVARAERLAGDTSAGPGPLPGYVWVTRAYETTDLNLAVELAERALALARDHGDTELELAALGELGRALVGAGKVDEGMPLLDEAMAGTLGGECDSLEAVVHSSCAMLNACDLAADPQRAAQWCRAATTFTRTYGGPFLYSECRLLYGGVLVATGDWAQAEDELTAAGRAAGDAYPALRARTLARLADLRLRQGRLEEAEALVAEAGDPLVTAQPNAAIRLTRGEPAVTVALCERRLDLAGDQHIDAAPTLGLLLQAHLATGDLDAASATATRLADLAAQRPSDHVNAHAALAAGRVLCARGELDRSTRSIEQAIERFASLELPLETARARLAIAETLAPTQPGVAVAEARGALAAFDRLGATADADAAAALLRSLGVAGRTGPKDAGMLTKREQEVLRLVSQGFSNPEIAERLFISRKTAAHHVSSVLAKLGVRNRAEAVAYTARDAGDTSQVSRG